MEPVNLPCAAPLGVGLAQERSYWKDSLDWQDVIVLIGIGMYIRFRTCTDVLVQFCCRSFTWFLFGVGMELEGHWGLKKHNVTLSSFPMRSLTWRSPAAGRVIRLRREVHAKACAKQDMLFFSFLLTRLSVSNLKPGVYKLSKHVTSLGVVLLLQRWIAQFYQPTRLGQTQEIMSVFILVPTTLFVCWWKFCNCGWLQSKQPPGIHSKTFGHGINYETHLVSWISTVNSIRVLT